ncbi:MAG: nitrate reductase molybdenum cofactor assembly chaperone [Formivibrio sp.]|nr:nitrate reductase molybdenum cofactor assembly chaperone [Formivibrio sp.]
MKHSPSLYRALSALLSYPEPTLLAARDEIDEAIGNCLSARDDLQVLSRFLSAHSLIELQENYVATFDRNPAHSLHLFEHIHGESRDRGQAMVDLMEEYRRYGLEPGNEELPDFVPLFLEFLGELPADEAKQMLGEAIHVLAAIGTRLRRNESPYAAIFQVLVELSDVVPLPLSEPPIRNMDEAMEMFGPSPDGTEPLLKPATQTIQFHPRAHSAR